MLCLWFHIQSSNMGIMSAHLRALCQRATTFFSCAFSVSVHDLREDLSFLERNSWGEGKTPWDGACPDGDGFIAH